MSVSSGRSSLSSVLSSCIMYDVTIFLAVETDCRHAGRQAVVLPLACCTTSSVVSHPQSAAWGTQDLCTQCSANVPRRPPWPATVQEAAGREGGRAAQIPGHGRPPCQWPPTAAAGLRRGWPRRHPVQLRQRAVKAAGVIGDVAGSHDSPISRFPWDLVSRRAPSPAIKALVLTRL